MSKFVNGDLAPKARGVVGHSWLLVCGSAINHRPSTTNQSGHQRSTTNHQPNWGERDFWGLSTCPPVAVIRRERGRDRVVEHQFIGLTPLFGGDTPPASSCRRGPACPCIRFRRRRGLPADPANRREELAMQVQASCCDVHDVGAMSPQAQEKPQRNRSSNQSGNAGRRRKPEEFFDGIYRMNRIPAGGIFTRRRGGTEGRPMRRGRRKWSGSIFFGPLGFSPRSNSVLSVVKGSAGGRKEEGRKRIHAAL